MRQTLTPEETLDLKRIMHYALGTQFGTVAGRNFEGAVTNVVKMHIEDLLTSRSNSE